MKTAISMPDLIFHQVSERATRLGLSRSEFLTNAAIQYLHHLDSTSITEQINELVDIDDDSTRAAVAAGRSRLDEDADGW